MHITILCIYDIRTYNIVYNIFYTEVLDPYISYCDYYRQRGIYRVSISAVFGEIQYTRPLCRRRLLRRCGSI